MAVNKNCKNCKKRDDWEQALEWAVRDQARIEELESELYSYKLRFGSNLLSEHAIVGQSKRVDPDCGVYFLLQDFKIVYVGQTQNGLHRIGQHFVDEKKAFDSYTFLPVPESQLNIIESAYIEKFNPVYNRNNGPSSWRVESEVL